jgi:glutamate 5-kinase
MLHKTLAAFVSVLLASCTSLSEAGREVTVVGSEAAVSGCRQLGYVSTRSGLRGIASLLAVDEQLETKLRNKVARKGGNYLLLEMKHSSLDEESYAYGTAYHCA